jgi:hypothetical protein
VNIGVATQTYLSLQCAHRDVGVANLKGSTDPLDMLSNPSYFHHEKIEVRFKTLVPMMYMLV